MNAALPADAALVAGTQTFSVTFKTKTTGAKATTPKAAGDKAVGKKAVTAQFDGSVKMQGLTDLRDMTKWSNVADGPNWRFPTNPSQITW